MKVLVACEFSGVVREAFRKLGHEAYSCDILPTEIEGNHINKDVRDILNDGWDLMVAHPPCTYLSNAGVRHLYFIPSNKGRVAEVHGEERWVAMYMAADFFKQLLNAPIEKIAVENPVPHHFAVEAIGRKYDQLVQPWMFGHGETKATCLWLKNLPKLVPTNIVEGREPRNYYMPPSPDRAKERSRTYQGIADAMAQQWGSLD